MGRIWRFGRVEFATATVIAMVLLLVVLAAGHAAPAFQRTVIESLIDLLVVVGLYIFIGNSGVVSFGHISFMAIGGYASAILTMTAQKKHVLLQLPGFLEHLQLPSLPAAVIAAAFAAFIAWLIGMAFIRLRGIALPMATFAMLMIVHVVAQNWNEVTGGRRALVGLPQFVGLWTALLGAVVALAAAAFYQQWRRGLLLRCSRENEVAAEASGIDIARERLLAFVVSAFFVALGGVLFAHFLGTITANSFYLDLTFVTLAMLVVGGMRSLTGAFVGTAVVTIVSEVFRSIERGIDLGGFILAAPPGLQEIGLALILLLILIFRRDGLVGDFEIGSIFFRTPKASGLASDKPNLASADKDS
ncbi:MAG TPA: branched-chain amino acid ABC transporter permease [Verrucomicrobiae bacterium]|nr:branched-chain amino acid ABC transporter permease [Verrucomicrobiae bacterium]